jgi:hypothetical protein
MIEIWKDINGYEGLYQVSNLGRVKSLERIVNNNGGIKIIKEHLLKPTIGSDTGYFYVDLRKNGKRKNCTIHRLVAQAFIPNPNNLPEVDHINRIRIDNRVENLRWADRKLQCKNSDKESIKQKLTNHPKTSKPVQQYTKNMVFIKEYPSAREASRQTGINSAGIIQCCNGKYGFKTAGGYIWKYKN